MIPHRTLNLLALATLIMSAPAAAEPATDDAQPVASLTVTEPQPAALVANRLHVVVIGTWGGAVEVVVRRDDDVLVVGPQQLGHPVDEDGQRRWETVLSVAAMDNGRVAVEARAVSPDDASPSVAAEYVYFLLNSPPPVPSLTASPGQEPGTATVGWEGLGDVALSAARIERAGPGQEDFIPTAELDPGVVASDGRLALAGLEPGEHRVRLVVERPAGLGNVLTAASESLAVVVSGPGPEVITEPELEPAPPAETVEATPTAYPKAGDDRRLRSAQASPPVPLHSGEQAQHDRQPSARPDPIPRRADRPRTLDPDDEVLVAAEHAVPPPLAAPRAYHDQEPSAQAPVAAPAPDPAALSVQPATPGGTNSPIAFAILLLALGILGRRVVRMDR